MSLVITLSQILYFPGLAYFKQLKEVQFFLLQNNTFQKILKEITI